MGLEQEALIRRKLWLDPRDGETRFGDFAEERLEAVAPRLELNTVAKYRSFLDRQPLPQWRAWRTSTTPRSGGSRSGLR